jgi:hypothetical protein
MQKSAAMEVNSEDGDRAPLHYWMRHDAAHHTGAAAPITNLAVMLSMIVHEIATNAAKYGALSNDTGTVTLDWEALEESDGRTLRMIWTEAGGPHVSAPVQSGFGSRLIECSARDQFGGEATVDFLPRGGVYTVTAALDRELTQPKFHKPGNGLSNFLGPSRCPTFMSGARIMRHSGT